MNQHLYKVLHKNSVGHIAKCGDDSNFQLFIGNVVMKLPEIQLLQFIDEVYHTDLNDPDIWVNIENNQKILVTTTSSSTLVILNRKELFLLKELLEYTKLLLELKYN